MGPKWLSSLNAQKACATATNCPLWAYVATPNQHMNPTKCFQPLSSVYTRPWKLWLGSVAAVAAAPKWPFVHKNRALLGPFCASAGGTDGNVLELQHFSNVDTLQLKCFDYMLTCVTQYMHNWEFFNEFVWILHIYTYIFM